MQAVVFIACADGDVLVRFLILSAVVVDLRHRAGTQELAAFDDDRAVGHLGQLGEDVRADEDRLALVGQRTQQFAELDTGAGVEPGDADDAALLEPGVETRCFIPLLNDLSVFSRMPLRLVKSWILSSMPMRRRPRRP